MTQRPIDVISFANRWLSSEHREQTVW